MSIALDGIRVIDAATMVAGPLGASLLADFGADVVKVEPITGDESRTFGPRRGRESGVFVGVNRNKRDVALDLRTEAGMRIFRELCAGADIVIDNMRPASKRRLGITSDDLRAEHPRLITVSVSSFGDRGPWADRPGLDPVAQALTGMMQVTGNPDGQPLKAGPPIADTSCGHLVAVACLVALLARERTGEGQAASVSLVEALTHLQSPWVGQYLLAKAIPPRSGNRSPFYAPYEAFATADGGLVHVVAFNDRFFDGLCRAVGRADLLEDERFATGKARMEHRDALHAELADWFSRQERDEAVRVLVEHDVICAPVLAYDEAFAHPQMVANEASVPMRHAALGDIQVPGIPVKLSGTPGAVRLAPPVLGQDTDTLLAELGYPAEQIAELRAAGAVT